MNPDPSITTQPEELTPEAKAILGKARRAFMVSMGVLLLGFIAIGVALVYRSSREEVPPAPVEAIAPVVVPQPGDDYTAPGLIIPADAQILSASAGDGLVSVTYMSGAITFVGIYDGKSGRLLKAIPIEMD